VVILGISLVIPMKSAKQKERELIIKLSNEKKTCREIASILGTSKSKAAYWIVRFKKTGKLEDKQRNGRPTKLTKNIIEETKQQIKSVMLEKNGKGNFYSKEALQILEHKTSKKYSLRHVQRIMHRMGFSLITPRTSHIRKDEKAQQKFRQQFKKNSKRNMWGIQS